MVLPDNQVGSPNIVLDNEMFEISINESDFDANAHPNDEEVNNTINSIKDLREENRNMLSYINEAIKLMLAITTNMSRVIEDISKKLGSKDNLDE
ncbi:hypothetical protein Tco_0752872 [Tanacetum coccineum]